MIYVFMKRNVFCQDYYGVYDCGVHHQCLYKVKYISALNLSYVCTKQKLAVNQWYAKHDLYFVILDEVIDDKQNPII